MKPAIQSLTVWVNALLPIIYLFVPGLKEVLTPEAAIGVLALINGVIRIFKTNTGIDGVI